MSRTGGGSTGTALLLAASPRVEQVVVFGPTVARLPEGVDTARIRLVPIWKPDDLWSLVRSGWAMWKESSRLDGFIFSLSVTTFGRRSIVNAAGLLLPVILRRATGKPVVVFVHNFIETQHLEQLGYTPTASARWAASVLERLIIRSTTAVVGLESQQQVVESALGGTVHCIPMRFAEMVHPWLAKSTVVSVPVPPSPGDALRVLLFGFWGPQKDLRGALDVLQRLQEDGVPLRVTVAGDAHPDFPEYARELESMKARLSKDAFQFVGFVPNEELRALFDGHDVMLMPYHTTGGYSGVMNLACGFQLPVVAYDLPELRENAAILGGRPAFVPSGNLEAIRSALAQIRSATPRPQRHSLFDGAPGGSGAQECVEELIRLAIGEATGPPHDTGSTPAPPAQGGPPEYPRGTPTAAPSSGAARRTAPSAVLVVGSATAPD
ncbi:MAG: glycosyltransferase [Thermoplasmata archaeon]|nr:glycosyltransferase [Thermoplasmata archaeon]